MDSLPPIPTPAGQRWREFRIRVLPLFVFIVAVAGLVSLWKGYVQPSGVVGEVETQTANVVSITDGQVISLDVERFDMVKQDQVLGKAMRLDPELIAASLQAIKADLQVLRARMLVERNRNEQQYQDMRLRLLSERILLAEARVNSEGASNEFFRVSELYKKQLSTGSEFDLARIRYESLQAQIAERSKLIKDMEIALPKLELRDTGQGNDPISLALEAKEREYQLTVAPIDLKAPIDGVVTLITRRAGEKVVKGDIILTISSPKAERVVGYLRQPINYVPTTNDLVVIRSRTAKRTVVTGQIIRVGGQLVPINPALLAADVKRMEVGLPILVALPGSTFKVSPGEYVDMAIKKSKG